MRTKLTRPEWLRDINQRQRNTVFPDTTNNEARFWRNLIYGEEPLTPIQKLGLGILVGMVLSVLVGMIISVGWDSGVHKFRVGDVAIFFLALGAGAALLWAFLWLFKVTNGRSGRG
ncbi:MAG TPA: hypothetical protein VJO35_15500 [Terriglobales bacterium]|nr:hypothetical protein [Terriglobales bacterium]